MVDLWRPWIEEKAQAQLSHLMDSIHDQQLSRACHATSSRH